jgi:hypothetical protein
MKDLGRDSFEFARQLRRIVPRIVVQPYQLCDGGKVVLKASFKLHLSEHVANLKARALLAPDLDQTVELDLFDRPQRAQHRTSVVALLREGKTYKEAAKLCRITAPAAQNAGALQRLMDRLRLDDPYVHLTSPPNDSRKLRRHLHRRYRFTSLIEPDAA